MSEVDRLQRGASEQTINGPGADRSPKPAPKSYTAFSIERSSNNPDASRHFSPSPPPQGSVDAARVVGFDFLELSPRERYKLLVGAIVPRPIALVTTISAKGVVNAAPYSFFNCLSSDPAIVALGVEYHPTGVQKDTGRNVRETLAFTVNIVSDSLVESMNICAIPFPPEVGELAESGLTPRPGVKVPCPWIAQSPAVFECRHHTTIGVGNSREIILGQVVYAHFRSEVVDSLRHHVDPVALDAVGRMGGHGYSTTRDYFDLPTMTLDTWRAGGKPRRQRRE